MDMSQDQGTTAPSDANPEGGDARAKALETADMLDEQLRQGYDDETERENAKAVMYELMGIDPETRLPIGFKAEPEPEEDPDKGDDADEADPTKDAGGAGDGTGTDTEPSEADKELERLRAEIAERDGRIAELSAKQQAADSEDDIRAKVEERLAGERTQLDEFRAKDDAAVQKAIDEYGEDVGKHMRQMADDAHKLREDTFAAKLDEEVDRAKAAAETELTQQARTDADIATVPDLQKWYDAAKGGDRSMWSIAHGVDATLMKDPEWMGKPQAERFAEVAVRVNKMVGAITADPDTDPNKGGDKGGDKGTDANAGKKTAEQIQAEIARKAAGQKKDATGVTGPGSLGDIGSGDAKGDLLSRLDEMDATEIAGLNLSAEQVDKIMLEREKAGMH